MGNLSLYGQLCKVDFAKAINATVELALPKFTQNKVLICNVVLFVENLKTEEHVRKQITIVFYRATNYTFVGTFEGGDKSDLTLGSEKQYLERHSYHNSCWRSDGTEHIIRNTVSEIINSLEGKTEKDYSVYTSFDIIPYKLRDGKVTVKDYDSNEQSYVEFI
jgi:hypothetical protein